MEGLLKDNIRSIRKSKWIENNDTINSLLGERISSLNREWYERYINCLAEAVRDALPKCGANEGLGKASPKDMEKVDPILIAVIYSKLMLESKDKKLSDYDALYYNYVCADSPNSGINDHYFFNIIDLILESEENIDVGDFLLYVMGVKKPSGKWVQENMDLIEDRYIRDLPKDFVFEDIPFKESSLTKFGEFCKSILLYKGINDNILSNFAKLLERKIEEADMHGEESDLYRELTDFNDAVADSYREDLGMPPINNSSHKLDINCIDEFIKKIYLGEVNKDEIFTVKSYGKYGTHLCDITFCRDSNLLKLLLNARIVKLFGKTYDKDSDLFEAVERSMRASWTGLKINRSKEETLAYLKETIIRQITGSKINGISDKDINSIIKLFDIKCSNLTEGLPETFLISRGVCKDVISCRKGDFNPAHMNAFKDAVFRPDISSEEIDNIKFTLRDMAARISFYRAVRPFFINSIWIKLNNEYTDKLGDVRTNCLSVNDLTLINPKKIESANVAFKAYLKTGNKRFINLDNIDLIDKELLLECNWDGEYKVMSPYSTRALLHSLGNIPYKASDGSTDLGTESDNYILTSEAFIAKSSDYYEQVVNNAPGKEVTFIGDTALNKQVLKYVRLDTLLDTYVKALRKAGGLDYEKLKSVIWDDNEFNNDVERSYSLAYIYVNLSDDNYEDMIKNMADISKCIIISDGNDDSK